MEDQLRLVSDTILLGECMSIPALAARNRGIS